VVTLRVSQRRVTLNSRIVSIHQLTFRLHISSLYIDRDRPAPPASPGASSAHHQLATSLAPQERWTRARERLARHAWARATALSRAAPRHTASGRRGAPDRGRRRLDRERKTGVVAGISGEREEHVSGEEKRNPRLLIPIVGQIDMISFT